MRSVAFRPAGWDTAAATAGNGTVLASRKVSTSLDLSPLSFDVRSMMRRASIAADERHDAFGCVVTRWLGYSRADGREPHCPGVVCVGCFFWRTFSHVTRSKHVGGAGRPRICNKFYFFETAFPGRIYIPPPSRPSVWGHRLC